WLPVVVCCGFNGLVALAGRGFLLTFRALGGGVGLLFQTSSFALLFRSGCKGLVALAGRGVQLTLRGLYFGLQVGKRCGSLGALLLQDSESLCRRAGSFLQTA